MSAAGSRAGAVATGLAGGLAATSSLTVMADDGLHPPKYPWPQNGYFSSFDHSAIRRGHQVFHNVCATCHSLNRIAFRNLVDVAYTEEEVKAWLDDEGIEVDADPNDEGEIEKRPAKLSDYVPAPYPNEQFARFANNGALPPDLSLVVKARHGGADYIFSLLTGYKDAPAGVTVPEGMHYNPYFPGGAIAMRQVLTEGLVDYDDGTEATMSQMAKDVTTFLAWAAEPEHDDRKRMGVKAMFILGSLFIITGYFKRLKWSTIKSRAISSRF